MTSARRKLEELLTLLDRVVAKLTAIQQAPRQYGTGVSLHGSEIHTIQAIGKNPGINVTQLSEKMRVTKGAVSQMVSRLVEKGMVLKQPARDSAKEVALGLTELGRTGYRNHEEFDMEVLDTVREYCGSDLDTKLDAYLSVIRDFDAILTLRENKHRVSGSIDEAE